MTACSAQSPSTQWQNMQNGLQVGYWKDLLEIVVRQCVSAEVMQQRTQQAIENQLAFAGKKHEGNKKASKQVRGCFRFTHECFVDSHISKPFL